MDAGRNLHCFRKSLVQAELHPFFSMDGVERERLLFSERFLMKHLVYASYIRAFLLSLLKNARNPSAAILRELGLAPLSFSNLTDLFSFLCTQNEKRKVQAIEGLWIKAFGMISSSGFEEIADEAIFISSEDLCR